MHRILISSSASAIEHGFCGAKACFFSNADLVVFVACVVHRFVALQAIETNCHIDRETQFLYPFQMRKSLLCVFASVPHRSERCHRLIMRCPPVLSYLISVLE